MERFLVLMALGAVCVNCGVINGKEYFCRDPDTGKLHAVNTTWTSKSFCGKYSCTMKRRNITAYSVLMREFNVTNLQDLSTSPTEETKTSVTIEKKIVPDIQPLLHKHRGPDADNPISNATTSLVENSNIAHTTQYTSTERENYKSSGHKCKTQNNEQHQSSVSSEDNDRYLTEKEIDKIADMLHTIRKSDLDAIVDIYQLAQDIYKEVDTITDEEIKQGAIHIMKEEGIHNSNAPKSPPKYWYDQLVNKGRVLPDRDEMGLQNPYDVYSTLKPANSGTNFGKGASSKSDMVEKIYYYYPVTQYERISSYTHPTYKITTENYNTDSNNENLHAKSTPNTRKLIQPSHYLPYPFANIHQNNSIDSRNFYYASPWMIDYYNKYKHGQPYFNTFIAPVRKAVLVNTQIPKEIQDNQRAANQGEITEKDLINTLLEEQNTQNWLTGPIPAEVLKDIRADIDTSRLLKAFPLRRKVKLEKVGKLINMDELNKANRNKRYAAPRENNKKSNEFEQLEAVLEKVTCHDQTQPGYFRIGNLTQPYPECCPQLIQTS